MIGGYGMKKDLISFSKPQECSFCKRIFLTPQELITHYDTYHSNHHFSTLSSSVATATPTPFRHYGQNLNRNPTPGFTARNHFDLNYYRRVYLDGQRKFHRGFPPAAAAAAAATTPFKKPNFVFVPRKKPKLMDLFSETSSEGIRTLPLLRQLEHRRPEVTVTENGQDMSSSIDLTLRL